MKNRLMACTAVVALMEGSGMTAQAAPWTRGFVVGAYEYAFRYGGRPDYSRGAEIEPGVDCPHGSTIHLANPDQTRIAMTRQKWRSQQEIDWITAPPGVDPTKTPRLTPRPNLAPSMSY